ncbi:MAG: hypothetical protein Q4P06_07655 [Actinomycetaceae bacterium]|nr:hypothetical protein [Actinomycetaceae bacterium]
MDPPNPNPQAPPPARKHRAPWFTIIATVLVVVIVAEIGYIGWRYLGEPGATSANYAPRQSTAVAISSLKDAKIDGGFIFREAAGAETNMRRQKIAAEDHYFTAAFDYHNYRITRVVGTNERGGVVGAIVGLQAGSSITAPVFEVPVFPDATCTIEDHVINCNSGQQLNLATATASVTQSPDAQAQPASDTADSTGAPTGSDEPGTDSEQGSELGPAFTYNPDYAASVHYPLETHDPQVGDFSATDTAVSCQGVDLSGSVDPSVRLWVFSYTAQASSWWPGSSKDTVTHLVVTPTNLVAVTDGVKTWEYQPAEGFAELNGLDSTPKITLVGSTLIFATNAGIIGLDANTGEVVWTITTAVESWALDAGTILVTSDGNLTSFDLETQAGSAEEQALTPTPPDPQNMALSKEDFRNGTYEVPPLKVNGITHEGIILTYVDGVAATGQEDPFRGLYAPYAASPIVRDGQVYTLVSMVFAVDTSYTRYSWGIYDHDLNLVDSFNSEDWPEGTKTYGYATAPQFFPPQVFGSLVQITSPTVAFKGDKDGTCPDLECSGEYTLNIRWTADGLVAEETTLTMDGEPLVPPKDEAVQALLDAWAMDDPDLARPYITDLDSFMERRNDATCNPPQASCYWGNVVFRGEKGKARGCNVTPLKPHSLDRTSYFYPSEFNNAERGTFVCFFDARLAHAPSSWTQEVDYVEVGTWMVVKTDENGHIQYARMDRSYS